MKKLKNQKGFTLLEMVCCAMILVLLTAVFAMGIRLAVDGYEESVSQAEAQQLCATLMTDISDELRYAGSTKVDASGAIVSLFSQTYGQLSSGFTLSDGRVQLGGKSLIAENAYTHNIQVTDLTVLWNDSASSFRVTLTLSRQGKELVTEVFTVAPLNSVKVGAASAG